MGGDCKIHLGCVKLEVDEEPPGADVLQGAWCGY